MKRPFSSAGVKLAVQLLLCMLVMSNAMGATKKASSKKHRRVAPAATRVKTEQQPAAATVPVRGEMSSICIESETGLVVLEENADKQRPPASMVKMMQLLLVNEGLKGGKWTLDTPIKASAKAAAIGGTGVNLKENEVFPLGQMMQAVAVCSANDAAMAVAENLWGDEQTYIAAINQKAKDLGMQHTEFHSVHGLPPAPGGEFDMTTARDMSRLAQFLVLEPQVLKWTSTKELAFRPTDAPHKNTNKLLETMPECDGLKTGFINSAGFCLTATAVRDGVRLISVVMGTNSNNNRFAESQKVLDGAFSQITKKCVIAKGAPVGEPVPVANCETPTISLTAAEDLWVVIKTDDAAKLEILPKYPALIQAPLKAGAPVGEVNVQLPGKLLGTVALTAPVSLDEAGLRWKLMNSLRASRK